MIRRAITIAGSDSGGGAGIQADLKTFSAFGVYGASAITALTAQNTVGVQGILTIPPDFFGDQLVSVLSDIKMDAGKTGMLADEATIFTLADVLAQYPIEKLVVDPVMISKHGAKLLEDEGIDALIEHVLPLACVATPNAEEASHLAGVAVDSLDDMREAAYRVHDMGARSVLVKGGHLGEEQAVDVLYDGSEITEFPGKRIDTIHTHGTGCTLSAAIAANLALGKSIKDSVAAAKDFITGAIEHSEEIGKGISPVDHLWKTRE
jgi:hydroxymethylpyrimidine/phosphomethylpyrimidine kinase